MNCGYLKVKLKNKALADQGDIQGTFQLFPGKVNERPMWTSVSQAIWYVPKQKDWVGLSSHWAIGDLDVIGEAAGYVSF